MRECLNHDAPDGRIFRIILIFLVILVQAVNAAQILAVLEIVPKADVDDISVNEIQHLTDELRKQATQALPQKEFSVLTRDNIIALIPPDEKEAECLAESCAVDIGRAIGAEYVTHGSIGKFSDEYSLSIELYETMGGKLLGSIVMESADIKGLLVAIREQSTGLFGKIKTSEPRFSGFTDLQDKRQDSLSLIPLSEPEFSELKNLQNDILVEASPSKISTWVAVSLDIFGGVGLGFGVYQYFQKEKFHNEYRNMTPGSFEDNKKAYDKADNARVMRDIGFVVGGILLCSGIAVHIFF